MQDWGWPCKEQQRAEVWVKGLPQPLTPALETSPMSTVGSKPEDLG